MDCGLQDSGDGGNNIIDETLGHVNLHDSFDALLEEHIVAEHRIGKIINQLHGISPCYGSTHSILTLPDPSNAFSAILLTLAGILI